MPPVSVTGVRPTPALAAELGPTAAADEGGRAGRLRILDTGARGGNRGRGDRARHRARDGPPEHRCLGPAARGGASVRPQGRVPDDTRRQGQRGRLRGADRLRKGTDQIPPKATAARGRTSPVPAQRLCSFGSGRCSRSEYEDGQSVPGACLPLRSRYFPARCRPPPTHATVGSGAAPGGGPAASGAGRNCLAACCATSCSRFALRSIFSQRALFLSAVRAW